MSKKVAVVMGSDSDLDTMRPCIQRLKSFGIPTEVHIISAHRTPAAAERFASQARENGFGAIIAAAGKAAHLAGVLAAYTTLPVIGVPIKTSMMGGLDSLLSMVQMPKGIPVACVAVDGADNAAILAQNDVKSVTVTRMTVPCCGGILRAVQNALAACGKDIPLQVAVIAPDGSLA